LCDHVFFSLLFFSSLFFWYFDFGLKTNLSLTEEAIGHHFLWNTRYETMWSLLESVLHPIGSTGNSPT